MSKKITISPLLPIQMIPKIKPKKIYKEQESREAGEEKTEGLEESIPPQDVVARHCKEQSDAAIRSNPYWNCFYYNPIQW